MCWKCRLLHSKNILQFVLIRFYKIKTKTKFWKLFTSNKQHAYCKRRSVLRGGMLVNDLSVFDILENHIKIQSQAMTTADATTSVAMYWPFILKTHSIESMVYYFCRKRTFEQNLIVWYFKLEWINLNWFWL